MKKNYVQTAPNASKSGSGGYLWKYNRNCITTKIKLYIHSRNTLNSPSSEYIVWNKKKELLYIHRLKKLPTSASKQIATNPKVQKPKHTIANLQKSGKTV